MQELIVLTGVVLFFVGVAAGEMLPRVVAFVASGSAFAYALVTLVRQNNVSELEAAAHEAGGSEGNRSDSDEDDVQVDNWDRDTDRSERRQAPESPVLQKSVREYEFRLSDFCDLEEGAFIGEEGSKSEFRYLIQKVLAVIKEVHFANTVAFSWINREKHQLVLEGYVSESTQFTSHRRRELGLDLVSQVALTGQPRILNNVNQAGQQESLGYYQNVEPVGSFAAVPVFYPRAASGSAEPVAVLWLDSLAPDMFGSETVVQLGQFAKVLSALIQSYTGKYDLLVDSEVLRSIGRLREQMSLEFNLQSIARSLAEETSRMVAWDHVAVVVFDEARKAWVVQVVKNRGNDAYVSVGQEIDPHGGIVGEVIQNGIARIIDAVAGLERPRFFAAERAESKGSLMVLPINSGGRCYGALVVESKDVRTYAEADLTAVQKLVDTASAGLEILALSDVVDNYILLDETTGVANRRYFMERLHEEVVRARDYDTGITMVMVSIDNADEQLNRYGKEGFDFILQNVGRLIKSFVRPYDLVGRFDFNRFAVMLIETSANEAYLWSEKVRKNIASNVINIDQRSFSVTVSVGVCSAVENRTDLELMENATQVLTKAMEAGGNLVRVY